MCLLAFFVFFVSICVFVGIMLHESRTLRSGASFLFMMMCLAVFLFFTLSEYAEWLAVHDLVIGILIIMLIMTVGCIIAFPAVLILVFFVEGIRVIRHEGIKPANLLSMLFSILLCTYLAVWPVIGNLGKNRLGTALYIIISFFGSICIIIAGYVFTFRCTQSFSSEKEKKRRLYCCAGSRDYWR